MKKSTIMKFGLLGIIGILISGFLFVLLWNWIVPEVFGGGELTYLQGFALLLIVKFLLGSITATHKDSGHVRKEKTKDVLFSKWWQEEGQSQYEDYLTEHQ